MKKLRLDYFLSLGLKLVDGDVYSFLEHPNRPITVTKAHTITNCPSESDKTTFIESFAWNSNFNSGYFNQPNELIHVKRGVFNYAITHWRYNINTLIKMQGEHDNKGRREDTPHGILREQMSNNKPQVDEKCRIEYMNQDTSSLTIDEFTLKFKTEKEYCGLDKDGYCFCVAKSDFIAWHPIDERSELDIAKRSQLISYQADIEQEQNRLHSDFNVCGMLEFMQKQGMLADIALGFEAND